VPDPSLFSVKIAIAKLKCINCQVVIKFWHKWFKHEVKLYSLRSIYKLINSIWNKEELPDQWEKSITVPFYMKNDKTDVNYCRISLLSSRSRKQRTDIRKYSFVNWTIQLWNQLHADTLGTLSCKKSNFKKSVRKVINEAK
jgi:hypothetical protein